MKAAVDAIPHRQRRTVRIVYVVLIAAVLIIGAVSYRSVDDTFQCSPPSDAELKSQEAFVRAHVADASDIELGTADCDGYGHGYVSFTTRLTATSARDAVLADRSCSPDDDAEEANAVSCTSGKFEVYVVFEAAGTGKTTGELNMG